MDMPRHFDVVFGVRVLDLNLPNVNDLRDEHGRTPLHYATTQLRFRTFKSIRIMYRPNINVPDSDGRTALHLACLLGYVGHTYITRKILALKTQHIHGKKS